jgi:hypothetical protein
VSVSVTCCQAQGDAEAAIRYYQASLTQCLIQDRHDTCELLCGKMCACSLYKRTRQLESCMGSQSVQATQQQPLQFASHNKFNQYLLREQLQRLAAKHHISLDSGKTYTKEEQKAKKKRKLHDALASVVEDLEGCNGEDSDMTQEPTDDDTVYMPGGTVDQLQPVDTQLTHPLAIKVLKQYLNSTHLKSLLRAHCYNLNTSYVESIHNVYLIYAPKRKHFRKTYDARIYLGVLDWMENIPKPHILLPGGGKMKEAKTFLFRHDITNRAYGSAYWMSNK